MWGPVSSHIDSRNDLFAEQPGIFNLTGFFVRGSILSRTDAPCDTQRNVVLMVTVRYDFLSPESSNKLQRPTRFSIGGRERR